MEINIFLIHTPRHSDHINYMPRAEMYSDDYLSPKLNMLGQLFFIVNLKGFEIMFEPIVQTCSA